MHQRQTPDTGDVLDDLGGLRRRQSSESDDGLGDVLGGLGARQYDSAGDDDEGANLGDILGGLKKRQGLGSLGGVITSTTEGLPVGGSEKRQSSESDNLGDMLSGLGGRQLSESGSDNGDDDDSLLNLLDGSGLKVDGSGQNINIADLRRRQLPGLGSHIGNANGDNDDSVLNAVDGSHAGVNQNAQNISVAELRRKRQLPNGLGRESESESDSGNGDNDDSLLNLLNGSAAEADHNIQNVTILRRYQSQTHHGFASLAARAKRWLSTFFGRAGPSATTLDSGNADDDEALANALNSSAAAVDSNAQDITALRRRQFSTPTPSTSAVTSASSSAALIAPAQDLPATAATGPAPRPALNAADNDNADADDNNRSDDDALANAADNSGADVSKNLQNITVLKGRHRRGSVTNDGDDNADDDKTLANLLDGSGLKADDNANEVDVADL